MPQCTRVFVAIAIPEPLERQLTQWQAELTPAIPGCRWTSSRPFHTTLAFLGDVPDADLNAVYHEVASSAGTVEPFTVELKALGAFPSAARPRVLWVGVTAVYMEALLALHDSIVTSLAGIDRRCDDNRFHPHVTLGRIKDTRAGPGDLTGLMERYRLRSAGECTVREVGVIASELSPTGPAYRVLSRCSLAGKKTEGRA
jgi:2'-5' RNA ligase